MSTGRLCEVLSSGVLMKYGLVAQGTGTTRMETVRLGGSGRYAFLWDYCSWLW